MTPGAAELIARQLPLALRPQDTGRYLVAAPPDPATLRQGIETDLTNLFLALASLALVIGAVGIASTTLVAVLERTNELGLRRALGARPRHIAIHILTESVLTGTLSGLLGATVGILALLAVSVANTWTAVLDPVLASAAPAIGALTGVAAGAYPAYRATRIEPAEALRN